MGELTVRLPSDVVQRRSDVGLQEGPVREQKAKSFELKLSVSVYDLYELRQNAGKYRSQLGEIYGFFSEGFDTPDLIRAKARLKNA